MKSGSHEYAPEDVVTREDLATALTARREARALTVRDVARRAGVPVATVGGYFSGRHVPPLAATAQVTSVLQALGITDLDEVRRWLDAIARVRRTPVRRSPETPGPYRGLAAFQPEDAEWFFGREALTDTLLERVRRGPDAPLVVVGASGAGKSSLLRAGLLGRLGTAATERPATADLTADSAGAPRASVLVTPGAHPLDSLSTALAAGGIESGRDGAVVVVDQMEEIFTECHDPVERAAFVASLDRLARAGSAVVLGLRADFYAHALRLPLLAEALQHNQIVLGPMSRGDVRRAVVEPARRAGVDVEEALVDLLLADLAPPHRGEDAYEAGALPMLAHALFATWQRGSGRRLSVRDYRAAGGITGAVASTAETVYANLTPDEQGRARRLFLRLVHVGADVADTRRRIPVDQVAERDLVERFLEARLLTADATQVQIAHETLLDAWPRLRGWIDADRAGLRTHRLLGDAAQAWSAAGRDPELLYRGARLEVARSWASEPGHAGDATALERDFLAASEAEEVHEQQTRARRTRVLRRLVAVLGVLLLAVGGLSGFAFQQRAVAAHQRDLAVSRQMSMTADDLRASDLSLAGQVGLAAFRVAPTLEARSSLLSSTASPRVSRLLEAEGVTQVVRVSPDGSLLAAAGADTSVRLWSLGDPAGPVGAPVDGGGGTVFALAFSPDGALLAAGGGDQTVRVWDIADPDAPRPVGGPLTEAASTVYALAFSPDGTTLAAAAGDGALHTWDVTTLEAGGDHGALPAFDGVAAHSVEYSHDGTLLAAGGADGRVVLWATAPGSAPQPLGTPLGEPGAAVYSVALSPDGATLAAGSADGNVYRWDVSRRDLPVPLDPLTGPASWVNAVVFSPDSRVVVGASSDNMLWAWDAESGALRATLPHPLAVTSAAFLPGGSVVATAANDGVVRLWELPGPVLYGTQGAVFATSFAGTGHVLATAASDGVRLWDTGDPFSPAALGPVLSAPDGAARTSGAAVLSPDGRTLAAGSADGAVYVWDVTDPGHAIGPRVLAGPTDLVESVAFSPDGRLLAAASDDTTVTLWDLESADPSGRRLTGPTNYVMSVAFSADGDTLAAGSVDKTVRLWDVSDPADPLPLGGPLTGPSSYVNAVAFSPDGRVLAAGGDDQTIWLWDVTDRRAPALLAESVAWQDGVLYMLAFSPDGELLAAAAGDGTVRIWDVSDPSDPARFASLAGAQGRLYAVGFSADGAGLAAGGADRLIRLYAVDPETAARAVCAASATGLPLTEEEWSRHLPDVRFETPCPP